MQDFLGKKRFWLVLGLSLFVPFFASYAQDDDDDDDDDAPVQQADPNEWKAKRDEIAVLIKKEINARAQKIVTHDKIVNVGFNNEINALRGIIDVSVIENKPGLKYGLKNDADLYERKLYNDLKRQRDYFYKSEIKKWETNMMPKYPKFDFQPKPPPAWSVPIPKPKKDIALIKEEMEQKLEKIFTDAYRLKSEEELFADGREKFKPIHPSAGRSCISKNK